MVQIGETLIEKCRVERFDRVARRTDSVRLDFGKMKMFRETRRRFWRRQNIVLEKTSRETKEKTRRSTFFDEKNFPTFFLPEFSEIIFEFHQIFVDRRIF